MLHDYSAKYFIICWAENEFDIGNNFNKGTDIKSLKNPSKVFKWCRTAIIPTENSKTTVSLENNWSALLGLGLQQK